MRKALTCLDATLAHLWLIEPPGGPYSMGVCQTCGASKMFANVEMDWTNKRGKRPPRNIGRARFDPQGGRRRA